MNASNSFLFAQRLYAVTDTRISRLAHVEQVRQLCEGGARLIQLREKHLSPREFFRQAEEALSVARSYGATIIINDRVDIALALKADGVHLGQYDLRPDAARRLLGDNAVIGFSTHSIEEAKAAATLPVDYLGVGPIFRSSTKHDPEPVVGVDGLRRIRELVRDLPLVAIGGITLETASDVLWAGADSIAIISALLDDPSQITSRTVDFCSLT